MPHREVGEPDGDRSVDRLLGELIAEVRVVKHDQRQISTKLDGLATIAATHTEILHRIEKSEKDLERQSFRLGVLEADKQRREGAVGLVEWFGKHWPFSIMLAAIAAFIAWVNGVQVK